MICLRLPSWLLQIIRPSSTKKVKDRELLPLMMVVNAGISIAPDEAKLDQQIVESVIPGPWGLFQAI
jgi:hypothetical protein